MIPFEDESSLTETEEYVEDILEKNWDHVVRSTSGIREDLEERFPKLSQTISRKINEDTGTELSNIFRPGVPDFMAFDDSGDYLFVEVKSEEDGLRATQLKWLRDFKGINMEIWFADQRNIQKIDESDFEAYGFNDNQKDRGRDVEIKDGVLKVEIPDELAAIIGLSKGTKVEWRLKSNNELILDAN